MTGDKGQSCETGDWGRDTRNRDVILGTADRRKENTRDREQRTGDKEQRGKTGDIGWETSIQRRERGDKGCKTGTGEGNRGWVTRGREKNSENARCAQKRFSHAQPTSRVFAHAQPTRYQFSRKLNQWVTNFRACSAKGEITTHFKSIIQNMLNILRIEICRWLSICGTYFIAGWANAERFHPLVSTEHTRKYLKFEYLSQLKIIFKNRKLQAPEIIRIWFPPRKCF